MTSCADVGRDNAKGLAVRYYIKMIRSDRDALRGTFGFYLDFWTSADQNMARIATMLTVPVLGIGGEYTLVGSIGALMMAVASNVQSTVITGAGH